MQRLLWVFTTHVSRQKTLKVASALAKCLCWSVAKTKLYKSEQKTDKKGLLVVTPTQILKNFVKGERPSWDSTIEFLPKCRQREKVWNTAKKFFLTSCQCSANPKIARDSKIECSRSRHNVQNCASNMSTVKNNCKQQTDAATHEHTWYTQHTQHISFYMLLQTTVDGECMCNMCNNDGVIYDCAMLAILWIGMHIREASVFPGLSLIRLIVVCLYKLVRLVIWCVCMFVFGVGCVGVRDPFFARVPVTSSDVVASAPTSRNEVDCCCFFAKSEKCGCWWWCAARHNRRHDRIAEVSVIHVMGVLVVAVMTSYPGTFQFSIYPGYFDPPFFQLDLVHP